jgi:hypothetical protein
MDAKIIRCIYFLTKGMAPVSLDWNKVHKVYMYICTQLKQGSFQLHRRRLLSSDERTICRGAKLADTGRSLVPLTAPVPRGYEGDDQAWWRTGLRLVGKGGILPTRDRPWYLIGKN